MRLLLVLALIGASVPSFAAASSDICAADPTGRVSGCFYESKTEWYRCDPACHDSETHYVVAYAAVATDRGTYAPAFVFYAHKECAFPAPDDDRTHCKADVRVWGYPVATPLAHEHGDFDNQDGVYDCWWELAGTVRASTPCDAFVYGQQKLLP